MHMNEHIHTHHPHTHTYTYTYTCASADGYAYTFGVGEYGCEVSARRGPGCGGGRPSIASVQGLHPEILQPLRWGSDSVKGHTWNHQLPRVRWKWSKWGPRWRGWGEPDPPPGSLPWPSHSQAQRQKSRVWVLRVGWWVVRQPPPPGWVGGCPNPLYFNVFQQTQSQGRVDNTTTVYIKHFEKEMVVAKIDMSPSSTGMLKKRDGSNAHSCLRPGLSHQWKEKELVTGGVHDLEVLGWAKKRVGSEAKRRGERRRFVL